MSVLEGRDMPALSSARIIENYRFFEEQIQTGKYPLNTIYQGIAKLIIVDCPF